MRLAAISSDSTADSHKLAERLKLNFPLLSDPDLDVIAAYGVAMQGEGVALPAVLVVMPNREVAWKYVGEDPSGERPTGDAVFEQAKAALAQL